jgi:hypothetical protein
MSKHAEHRTFTLIDYDPAEFQTPPRLISKGGGTSVPRKLIKKKPSKKNTDLTPRPFDFDVLPLPIILINTDLTPIPFDLGMSFLFQ